MITVNAAVYTAPNTIRYISNHQIEQPERDDDILLKVLAAGVCGSDRHAYHGNDPRRKPGLILGHEFSAIALEGEFAGKLVTANPLITCGKCSYCQEGRNNLCSNRDMIGMNRQGAFADFVKVPRQCLAIAPDHLHPNLVALTEPAATVVHGVNLLQKNMYGNINDANILVIGGGAIGFLTALLLKNHTHNLTVLETNTLRLEQIKKYIGVTALNPMDAIITPHTYTIAIDCVGSKVTRNTALDSIKAGGTILHIGLQHNASEIDMRKLTLSEIALIGSYTYTMDDFKLALEYIVKGSFGRLDWVAEAPLNEVSDVFRNLDNGTISSPKIVLNP